MSKYSIILPVRNGGSYIKECIGSLLAQTLQDFNVLVLDNCSTDGTSEWLASLQNEKLIIIPAHTPLSIEENWGRIKDIAKNEYITLIGHDDILYPNFLESINGLIQQYPNASLYHTHFNFIGASGKVMRSSKPMPAYLTPNDLLTGFLTQTIDSMGTGYVMRAKDYDAVGGIPVRYPNLLFADFDLWLSMAQKGGVAVHPNNCFAFRVHQSTTGKSPDGTLHKALACYIKFLAGLKSKDAGLKKTIVKYGADFLMFYCKGFAHRLLRTPLNQRNGITVRSFIDETKQLANLLGVGAGYNPGASRSIRFAAFIDRSKLLRQLFLGVKKLYPKPFS